MSAAPASLEQARDRVVQALGDAWAADQLTEREHGELAKAAGAAANMNDLLAVAAELRARVAKIAEVVGVVESIRAASERAGGPSLEDAREALTERLKALWSEDQIPLEDFERLAAAVGRAADVSDLRDVAAQLRTLVDRNKKVLEGLRGALDFGEPWPKRLSKGGREGPRLLDEDALAALLAPGGAFAAEPEYEDRRGQREMLRLVARRFNEGGVGLVEAGTGTGKSLAYLTPAASWALRNRERTIVSTNTINLQQQLVFKDLPLAQDVLGEPLKWALFKGRGNYASIRRARLAAKSAGALFADGKGTDIDEIMKWLEKTRDGSKSDLPVKPAEEVWNEVKSDTDACLRDKCPHYQECFYFRARRGVADADVVVVNHALFFADLNIRIEHDNFDDAVVLPRYRRVIFDEAHRLDEAATEAFKTKVKRHGVLALLSRLHDKRRPMGLLVAVAKAFEKQGGVLDAELRQRVAENAVEAVELARERTDEFFDALRAWTVRRANGERARRQPAARQDRVRLPIGRGQEPADDIRMCTALDNLRIALGAVSKELSGICERVDDENEESLGDDLKGRVLDLRSSAERLVEAGADLERCLLPGEAEDVDWVRWLEMSKDDVQAVSAPVSAGPLLRKHLFGRVDAAVLTSATMALGKSFDHFKEWTGLQGDRTSVHEDVVKSPFDYRKQAVLKVCKGADGTMSGPHVARILSELAEITGGGVMALFTSHDALRDAAKKFQSLPGARWEVFVQGGSSRYKLIRKFKRAGNGILFGTQSFWEGVDIPGQSLRALVIHKLPFPVPGEPVAAARKAKIEARGENGFFGYTVPVAGLSLKQGVGRLIRARSDRGAVVLLDDRVWTKPYGRAILAALPPMPVEYREWSALDAPLRDFYAAGPPRAAVGGPRGPVSRESRGRALPASPGKEGDRPPRRSPKPVRA